MPLLSIPRPSGGTPFAPLVNPARSEAPLGFFCYAPADDIANPLLNAGGPLGEPVVGEPHDSQQLTIFLPDSPPSYGPLPTVLFSTAGEFAQASGTPPPPPQRLPTFLGLALERGWCVVTVGGVGFNSEPTTAQIRRCNLNGGATNPAPCWDYNLWYPPDGVVTPPSPWNDFNYFYGEKDLVWARQWIAQHADDPSINIDNDRIVVSGSSTGAIYGSFLAYQPNRAWSGSEYSDQSKQDTRVAAYVAWDPVVWMEAIPNLPAPNTFVGVHWPKDLDEDALANAYRERIPEMTAGIPNEQLLSLRAHGASNYVRQYAPLVPTWMGAGDPNFAIFGRNAAAVEPDDYERDDMSLPPNDPTLSFPTLTATVLHDLWNMLILKQDLLAVAAAYYARHCRLELRDSTNWSFIPASLSSNDPPSPPISAAQVPLVNGTFVGSAGCTALGLAPECIAVESLTASTKAVAWMNREVCRDYGLAVQCRNAGINFSNMTFTPASIGGTATGKVYLCECPDGYDAAWIFGYDSSGETSLGTGDVLLCHDGGSGELLGLTPKLKPPSHVVTFEVEIPNDPALIGFTVHTQAWMYDFDGVWDSALTNAQDLEIQP